MALAAAGFGAAVWYGSADRRAPARAGCGIATTDAPDDGMVLVHGGRFRMGAGGQRTEEGPARETRVDDFWISRHDVTNAQYARFVRETGYVTLAERRATPGPPPVPSRGLSLNGGAVFQAPSEALSSGLLRWWRLDPGASWRHPEGATSRIAALPSHPVVQVSFEDAQAFARWAGMDLPTEAQWEYAARGGLDGNTYVWGNDFNPDGRPMANTWQGEFPLHNSLDDGFAGTSPVGCFPPNRFGLYDMAGNVWQWTRDPYVPGHNGARGEPAGVPQASSQGAASDSDPANPGVPSRVIKGGSFLCAANYCASYRPAARQPHESDLGTDHIGFRTVRAVATGPAREPETSPP